MAFFAVNVVANACVGFLIDFNLWSNGIITHLFQIGTYFIFAPIWGVYAAAFIFLKIIKCFKKESMFIFSILLTVIFSLLTAYVLFIFKLDGVLLWDAPFLSIIPGMLQLILYTIGNIFCVGSVWYIVYIETRDGKLFV
jgi:hypothetical protein